MVHFEVATDPGTLSSGQAWYTLGGRRGYERASTIITSNRPIDDWPKLFGDTPAVAAFLDRLMHHSHLIEIRGKSYRLHESSLAARRRNAS